MCRHPYTDTSGLAHSGYNKGYMYLVPRADYVPALGDIVGDAGPGIVQYSQVRSTESTVDTQGPGGNFAISSYSYIVVRCFHSVVRVRVHLEFK